MLTRVFLIGSMSNPRVSGGAPCAVRRWPAPIFKGAAGLGPGVLFTDVNVWQGGAGLFYTRCGR